MARCKPGSQSAGQSCGLYSLGRSNCRPYQSIPRAYHPKSKTMEGKEAPHVECIERTGVDFSIDAAGHAFSAEVRAGLQHEGP